MTFALSVLDARGRRSVPLDQLPLVIGGPGADLEIPATAEPQAYIGTAEGELFVQPADGGADILCNGTPLRSSQWLRDGDVLLVSGSRILIRGNAGASSIEVEACTETTAAQTGPPVGVPTSSAPPLDATSIRPVAFEPRPLTPQRRGRRLPGVTGLASGAALVLLALVAWFLFGARSIAVEVSPEPDRLSLHGSLPTFELAGRHLVRPGIYLLVAEKQGYAGLEVPLKVTEGPGQQFRFTLELLPGRLAVDTLEGARLEVDGREIGTSPLPAIELAPGVHEIRVTAKDHLDFVDTITIVGGGIEQTLVADLVSRWTEVGLASEPSGARVIVDGRTMGETPLTIPIPDGRHEIELRLAGFESHRQALQVTADEAVRLPTVRLVPADGVLVLASEPSGAAVSVDGAYRGETPLAIELSPGRTHKVSISRAGYESTSRELSVDAGSRRELSIPLRPRFGTLEIAVAPDDAEVLVDGVSQGRGDRNLELPATEHVLEVRLEGYERHSTTVTPRPGFPLVVDVQLRHAQEAVRPRQPVTPPRLVTSQGQALLLVGAGRFEMGASRREAGRRANETLREIELTRPFYLGAREVTNREFRAFRPDHRSGSVAGVSLDGDDQPVVRVNWEDAARYCNWLSEQESLPPVYREEKGNLVATLPLPPGYRLPTEAEWAWAARFPDGSPRKYPWGDSLPVAADSGNYADVTAGDLLSGVLSDYRDGFAATAPVESFGPDRRGFFGIGGNVAEWVHDFYTIYSPGVATPERDPVGPPSGEFHVIRGSSWMHSTVTELRLSFRDYGDEARPDVGFRIARPAEAASDGPTRTTP